MQETGQFVTNRNTKLKCKKAEAQLIKLTSILPFNLYFYLFLSSLSYLIENNRQLIQEQIQ